MASQEVKTGKSSVVLDFRVQTIQLAIDRASAMSLQWIHTGECLVDLHQCQPCNFTIHGTWEVSDDISNPTDSRSVRITKGSDAHRVHSVQT